MSDYEQQQQHQQFVEKEHNEESITSTQNDTQNVEPSAPPATDENGYILVQQSIDSAVESVVDQLTLNKQQEEMSNLLVDITNSTETGLQQQQQQQQTHTVVAEADSSVNREERLAPEVPKKPASSSSSNCSLCPYYLLACDYLTKIEIPQKVRDLLLWKCPKLTGAVFGTSFVLLLSLSLFSLLTVVSSLMLTGLAVLGAYRFYLALIFRIKGTYDDTFDKLSKFDLSLPKDKIQELSRLLETDINSLLNRLKSVLLWDNVVQSVVAFVGFYFVYLIGSCFNTLTLLLFVLVDLFTLPKVYQVYKQPIDQCIQKATDCVHNLVRQVLVKVPILNKKKTN